MDVFGSLRKLTKIVFPTNSGAKNVELQAASQTGASPVVVSIPDVGDSAGTLVEVDAAQTLTQKTLTTPVINGAVTGTIALPATSVGTTQLADNAVTDVKLRDSAGFSVIGKATTGSGDPADIALAADRVLGRTGSGDVQGIQVADAQVATGAAITRSKLASGTASHVIINDGSGVLSSEAQLATSRGGTGVNSTATFPSSGVVVTRSATESLTNKTLDDTSNVLLKGGNTTGATVRLGSNDSNSVVVEANNADRITARVAAATDADVKLHGTAGVELPTGTAAQRPSSPVNGTIRHNTDTNEFEGYSAGAWQAVGGGVNELPLKNYLKPYATASIAPGTLSTVAAGGNIATTAGLFYADTTSGSAALTQSTSTALRGAANYLSAVSGADTAGGRFFQFPAFALEGTDLGKPVTISFDISSSLADGDWDVVVVRYNSSGTFQELIPVAGNASSSSSTPSAKLPGSVAQFNGFFVAGATSGDLYAIRFRRLANSQQIRLDTLYVGPQQQLVGAQVTDWQSYTLTIGGSTSAPTPGTTTRNEARWRRVGDSMEIHYDFLQTAAGSAGSGVYLFPLPSGYAVDTSKFSTPNQDAQGVVGSAQVRVSVAYTGSVNVYDSTNLMISVLNDTTALSNPSSSFAALSNTAIRFSFKALVPIANWSSNVQLANRAVEEYAYNSSTSTTTDTTSFAYGAVGVALQAFAPAGTASVSKRIRFQTPIQATDRIVLEFKAGGFWVSAAEYLYGFSTNDAGTTFYGCIASPVSGSTTDVNVIFYSAPYVSGTWSAEAAAGVFWRVRKVSGGAAVGFPVGARNVVGDITGTAVPVGNIGERQTAANTTTNNAANTVIFSASITLQPGVWDLSALASLAGTGTLSGTGSLNLGINTAANFTGTTHGDNRVDAYMTASVGGAVIPAYRVTLSAATTYYAVAAVNVTSGTGTMNLRLIAVRVG